jgi:hypothetical protein
LSRKTDDYDSPWKELLGRYFFEFAEFFFPIIARETDRRKGHTFLDKELRQIVRDAELGTRLADKLVRVWKKNGEEAWVLIHVEVQGKKEAEFAKRMFVYNYRIFDRYDRKVASLAILTDSHPGWNPDCFAYELWGCEVGIRFPVAKLSDYADKWEYLGKSDNPFAFAVMAHLKTRETRNNRNARREWKVFLVKRLYEKGYGKEDVIALFHFIDWMMRLPDDLEKDFWQEISRYEEEKKMPYVSSVERIGIQKGIRQGIQQGIQQGTLQGRREGLREAIEMGLSLKFGENGLRLMSAIQKMEDTERLNLIKETIKRTSDLKEIENMLK